MTTETPASAGVEQTSEAPPFDPTQDSGVEVTETMPDGSPVPEAAAEDDGIPRATDDVDDSPDPAPAEPELKPMTALTIESVEARIAELDRLCDEKVEAANAAAKKSKDELEARLKKEREDKRSEIDAELKKTKAQIRGAHKDATRQWRVALNGLKAEAAFPADLSEPPADKTDEKSSD